MVFLKCIIHGTEDGSRVMILILIALEAYIMKRNRIGVIASVIATIICLIDFMSVASVVHDSYGIASHAIGAYLSLIAVIVMAAVAFIRRGRAL